MDKHQGPTVQQGTIVHSFPLWKRIMEKNMRMCIYMELNHSAIQ